MKEGEIQSLPFGGDIQDAGKKDVQEVLLVAKYKNRPKGGRGQIMGGHRYLVKEFGQCPVGNGSLRTVWWIHLKGLSLEAGSPTRRALPLELCPLLEAPLAL